MSGEILKIDNDEIILKYQKYNPRSKKIVDYANIVKNQDIHFLNKSEFLRNADDLIK